MDTLGMFAVYKGIEYETCDDEHGLILVSEDEASKKYGFTRSVFDTHYELAVNLDEVERYYTKQLVGVYRGHTLDIIYENGDEYCLSGGRINDFNIYGELGFEMVGRLEYEKMVPKSEMERVWWEIEDLLEKER